MIYDIKSVGQGRQSNMFPAIIICSYLQIQPTVSAITCNNIEVYYITRKITVAASCRLVYRVNAAHLADHSHAWRNKGVNLHNIMVR